MTGLGVQKNIMNLPISKIMLFVIRNLLFVDSGLRAFLNLNILVNKTALSLYY
jgi:hypothetical protein